MPYDLDPFTHALCYCVITSAPFLLLPTTRYLPPNHRPLRVGYISPDLFTHSVSYFVEVPLSHHRTPLKHGASGEWQRHRFVWSWAWKLRVAVRWGSLVRVGLNLLVGLFEEACLGGSSWLGIWTCGHVEKTMRVAEENKCPSVSERHLQGAVCPRAW
jgi:hypothetical protein